MYLNVEEGTATANSINHLHSLEGLDPNLLTFSFDSGSPARLSLTDSLSPGAASEGYEVYTNPTGIPVILTFTYDLDSWATAEVLEITTHVTDWLDDDATGKVRAVLTGGDSAFYEELMFLSDGSGELDFTFDSFYPVSNPLDDLFASIGSFTVANCDPQSLMLQSQSQVDPNLIAEAGDDQTAVEGGYVRVKGTNVGGNGLQAQDTFQWIQLQGPTVTPDQNGGFDFAMFNFEAPEVDVVTELIFGMTLSNGGTESRDTMSILVYPIPDLMVDGVEFD
ncbi:MAG: hypothetical protein VW711_04240, partial [Verrucomicrobiales bacterium]